MSARQRKTRPSADNGKDDEKKELKKDKQQLVQKQSTSCCKWIIVLLLVVVAALTAIHFSGKIDIIKLSNNLIQDNFNFESVSQQFKDLRDELFTNSENEVNPVETVKKAAGSQPEAENKKDLDSRNIKNLDPNHKKDDKLKKNNAETDEKQRSREEKQNEISPPLKQQGQENIANIQNEQKMTINEINKLENLEENSAKQQKQNSEKIVTGQKDVQSDKVNGVQSDTKEEVKNTIAKQDRKEKRKIDQEQKKDPNPKINDVKSKASEESKKETAPVKTSKKNPKETEPIPDHTGEKPPIETEPTPDTSKKDQREAETTTTSDHVNEKLPIETETTSDHTSEKPPKETETTPDTSKKDQKEAETTTTSDHTSEKPPKKETAPDTGKTNPKETVEKKIKTIEKENPSSPNTQETTKENIPEKKLENDKNDKEILEKNEKSDELQYTDTLNIAEKLLEEGSPQKSLKLFEELLETNPNNPEILYGKARSLDELAEIKRSNELLQDSIKAYEKVASAPKASLELKNKVLRRQAERLGFLGKNKQAARLMKKLCHLFPNDIDLLNELGVMYLISVENAKAEQVFAKVLEREPNSGFAKVHLGFVYKSDKRYSESIPLLREGIDSMEKGTDDSKFFFHLGDALYRIGEHDEAHKVYERAAKRGHFRSKWQRSLYNVDSLRGKPWWTVEETGFSSYVKKLEDNWEAIRDEGLALINAETGGFKPEEENLREAGDWGQFLMYQQGRKNGANCKNAPKTCAIIDSIPDAKSCKRGQVKFSIMQPGTHVWPHCGPTNCRLRMHLGLVIPSGVRIRVQNDTRTWEEGKVIIFDDSFEHEVWQDAESMRLVLIVDMWHPDLTQGQKATLTPI